MELICYQNVIMKKLFILFATVLTVLSCSKEGNSESLAGTNWWANNAAKDYNYKIAFVSDTECWAGIVSDIGLVKRKQYYGTYQISGDKVTFNLVVPSSDSYWGMGANFQYGIIKGNHMTVFYYWADYKDTLRDDVYSKKDM